MFEAYIRYINGYVRYATKYMSLDHKEFWRR